MVCNECCDREGSMEGEKKKGAQIIHLVQKKRLRQAFKGTRKGRSPAEDMTTDAQIVITRYEEG